MMERIAGKRTATVPQNKVRLLVMTGLLAALCCVTTMVLPIPSPTGGYVNLGDTVVLLGAYLLGPWYGALAAGVGSALSDILAGYVAYAPATLVIKAAMAVVAGLMYRVLRGKHSGALLSGALGELPMLGGYCLYDAWLLQSWIGGAAGIPGNLVQAAFGVAASTFLTLALQKSRYVQSVFPNL